MKHNSPSTTHFSKRTHKTLFGIHNDINVLADISCDIRDPPVETAFTPYKLTELRDAWIRWLFCS